MSTTMTTDQTRRVSPLVTYLKRRFGTRENLAQALGMDARELKALLMEGKPGRLALDEEVMQAAPSEADKAWRLAVEKALTDGDHVPTHVLKKIFALLDEKHPLGDDEPLGERAMQREEHGEEALDAGELARVLREYGVNADDESVKRALDDMPMNALGGSLGGRFAMKRAGEHGGGAMDSAASKFNISVIVGDAGLAERAGDRRRAAPSARGEASAFKRFAGTSLASIGVHGGSPWQQ